MTTAIVLMGTGLILWGWIAFRKARQNTDNLDDTQRENMRNLHGDNTR